MEEEVRKKGRGAVEYAILVHYIFLSKINTTIIIKTTKKSFIYSIVNNIGLVLK